MDPKSNDPENLGEISPHISNYLENEDTHSRIHARIRIHAQRTQTGI